MSTHKKRKTVGDAGQEYSLLHSAAFKLKPYECISVCDKLPQWTQTEQSWISNNQIDPESVTIYTTLE